jgi:hypothetical protein
MRSSLDFVTVGKLDSNGRVKGCWHIHTFYIKHFFVLKSGSKAMMQRKEMRSAVRTSVTAGNRETPGPVFGRRTCGV